MSEDNLPDEGTVDDGALTFEDGADAISNLLDDSDVDDPNTKAEDQGQKADEEEAEPEAEEEDGEADDSEATDEEDDVEAEDEDESEVPETSEGKYVAHNAKVKLDNGETITVAELARNNLFHADYTRKTQELAEERKTIQGKASEVESQAEQLRQQQDFLLQVAQQFLPQKPDPSMIDEDIFGYQRAMAEWEQKMGLVGQIQQMSQAEMQRRQQEEQARQQEWIAQEGQKLVEKMPELRDGQKFNQFWSNTVNTLSEYGFSPSELENSPLVTDHRLYPLFRDLMAYRNAKKKAPQIGPEDGPQAENLQ